MLKFIGYGSAFNTRVGNNGAYMKKGKSLLLIDCGSSTFSKIQKSNLLQDVENIVVLLTHTHPDHVGSLGDLIFYGYYSMGKMMKPNVIVVAPSDLYIQNLLNMMGVNRDTYHYHALDAPAFVSTLGIMIEPVKVKHVEELNCYGYVITDKDRVAYYSGDCYEIPEIILHRLNKNLFDYFYQDTCKADYDGNVHLSLRKLEELVSERVRNKVYCMHLDGGFDRKEAEDLGFRVVSFGDENLWAH